MLMVIFAAMLASVYKGLNIVFPLLFGLVLILGLCIRKGFSIKQLFNMICKGCKRSLIIIHIFVLIGAITAMWRASGTVAFIVYYGIKLMNPDFFILSAFVLSSIVSFLLGTAFGTVGTIGIVLMVIAKTGSVNVNLLAGAVIAGAYFGDRCSPMSSSANLIASITDTNIYKNIKNMMVTSIIPMILSLAAYSMFSLNNPLIVSGGSIEADIMSSFNISIIVIIPALAILILSAFRLNVKMSMSISIAAAIVIAVIYQQESLIAIARHIVLGYSSPQQSFFMDIIKGGGLISMLRVSLIVLISFAYAEIFEGTKILKETEAYIVSMKERWGIFPTTMLLSIVTASFGCTQAISIMLTNQLAGKLYEREEKSKYELALDLEDSSVVVSPLIPWNIGGAVPAAALSVGIGFIPYAVYLYLLPIISLLTKRLNLVSFKKKED